MKTLTFYKNSIGNWYIDIPWEGDPEDLQMVEGADLLLDILSEGDTIIQLIVSTENPYDDSFTRLELVEHSEYGGGLYSVEYIKGTQHKLTIWLCGVIEHVLKGIPSEIWYLKV